MQIRYQGGMQAGIDASHKAKAALKKEEERKHLMASLFAGIKTCQKVDEDGVSK